MFNTLMLRLEGLGYLEEIKDGQETTVARIQLINKDEFHCNDECTFDCRIPNKLIKLFSYLKEICSKGQIVMLAFLANYRDFYVWEFCSKEDPDRCLHFYAELDNIEFICIDGIKHSVKDLLKNIAKKF
jgi:hypothetical protein